VNQTWTFKGITRLASICSAIGSLGVATARHHCASWSSGGKARVLRNAASEETSVVHMPAFRADVKPGANNEAD
jgi:hypothetical protein